MKKMYTRFLALVMAFAMVFSCTAVASAAEAPAVTVSPYYEELVPLEVSDGIMPMASAHIVWEMKDYSYSNLNSSTFYASTNSDLVVTIATTTRVQIEVFSLANGLVGGYTIPNTNGQVKSFSLGSVNGGWAYYCQFNIMDSGRFFAILSLVY